MKKSLKRKIKVLYCQETIHSGGVEQVRLTLAKYLDPNKYEFKIICTYAKGPLAEEMAMNGMEVIPIGGFKHLLEFKQYKKVLKIIKDYKPDIIHGGVFEGVTMATVTGFIGRVPIIIAEETSDPQNRSKKASYLLKLLTLVADRVVGIAPKVSDYLTEVAKISPSKVLTITYGVNDPRVVSQSEIDNLRSALGIQQSEFVIGSVGRLFDDHKKFTNVVKSVALLEQKSKVKILIVGHGNDEELIKNEAYKLGLLENLIMVGYQYDTAPYYKLMDLFCLASQREGLGLVAAEAMLHELPVVATRVGGLQDIVVENETGLLVEPNKPDQMAEAINKLLSNQNLMMSMGSKGKVRAELKYSSKRYVREVDDMYNELLRQKQII